MTNLFKSISLIFLAVSTSNLKSSERTTIDLAFSINFVTSPEIIFIKPGTEITKSISTDSKTNRTILQEIAVSAGLPVANTRLAFGKREINLNNDHIFGPDELFSQLVGTKDHK